MLPRYALLALQIIATCLPPRIRGFCALAIGHLEFRVDSARRAAVLGNLAQIAAAGHRDLAEPDARERAARAIFRNRPLAWMEYLAKHPSGSRGTADGTRLFRTELLYAAISRGRGVVLTVPHLGSWELAALTAARQGLTVHVVTGIQLHPFLADAVRARKARERIRVSTPEAGFRPLLTTLREGGIVALLVDGDVFTRSLPARFFGRDTPFPAGPAILARRTGAPLLHGHAEREPGGSHRFTFDALDRPDYTLPLREDLIRLTVGAARAQERNVASHVTQWCVFRPFWGSDAA